MKIVNGVKFHNLIYGNTSFKGKFHSEETKKKMSDAKKGIFDGKKNPSYGKHWITNGLVSNLVPKNEALPRGFEKGRT